MYNFETIQTVAVPKGENRQAAEQWLCANGLEVPELPVRCLHEQNR
jgi:hypothetical protein